MLGWWRSIRERDQPNEVFLGADGVGRPPKAAQGYRVLRSHRGPRSQDLRAGLVAAHASDAEPVRAERPATEGELVRDYCAVDLCPPLSGRCESQRTVILNSTSVFLAEDILKPVNAHPRLRSSAAAWTTAVANRVSGMSLSETHRRCRWPYEPLRQLRSHCFSCQRHFRSLGRSFLAHDRLAQFSQEVSLPRLRGRDVRLFHVPVPCFQRNRM